MFKFGRKDKSKSEDKKKERKDSKKEKKTDSLDRTDDSGSERYTSVRYPPAVAPKPKNISGLHAGTKNGKSHSTKGILKIRSSNKAKSDHHTTGSSKLDDDQILRENTRINEEYSWRVPPDAGVKSQAKDIRKRESIHSITMNIAPPSAPPPASAAEKVYSVDLELPTLMPPSSTTTRDVTILRQPKGDFGFNLRWAPYKDASTGIIRQAVHAEPGSSGAKSGIITGDRIVTVNGKNMEHSTREEVIALIQKSGETLRLQVQQIPEVRELNQRPGAAGDEPATAISNGGEVCTPLNVLLGCLLANTECW